MTDFKPPAVCNENSASLDNHDDDKTKILNSLFHECCVDPTIKREDETFLQMSLRTRQPDAFVLLLMKTDSDTDVRNRYGSTPLHTAIKRPMTAVAKELLERGADVNAQDGNHFTPLHFAAMKSHEAVCMLLYYDADVSIVCGDDMLPLNLAFCSKEFDSAETLLNYYDDQDLFEEFNLFSNYYGIPLEHLLSSNNPGLFKQVWSRMDHNALTELSKPFLVYYLSVCTYSLPQWIDCLQLILQSNASVDLIEDFNSSIRRTYGNTFLSMVLYAAYTRGICMQDRTSIMYLTLSLGLEASSDDINSIYGVCGFGGELETIIFTADYKQSFAAFDFVPLHFIFALEDDFSVTRILYLFEQQLKSRLEMIEGIKPNSIISTLKFFSLHSEAKAELLRMCPLQLASHRLFATKVQTVPEFPSLLELSRNEIYKSLKMKTACQFHSAVKRLDLPQKLEDIVRFKAPLY